ncbi:ChbG/HpnK family deacetylase [Azospirillum doebereinerae]|uniref:ChbG/HpnK family deacetylase n=1 Tax=Azospirillum doebereinerae TaxID=92933 RepID=A0A433J499_9PROT|nr:ChbG/HpnK family deacetylase [Azospirillum doebereinerae]MCG5238342.1 ChbG/HpnK family deacetylase [Azospirillum doebereinerae]RUQ66776.1 ChbG/HpnK family deacetylase [Azospirillum doebereinerae]
MTTPILLCADDYGLAPGVNAAIRELIAAGRLTATSVMSLCPFWVGGAAPLRELADRADVGLHFTLTDQAPLGPMPRLARDGRLPPLGRLMGMAYTGRLDPAEIRDELARQLDAFAAAWGGPPAYIDGHQHVHQLPTVRDAVADALSALPGAYVRLCGEPAGAVLRRGVAVPKTLLIGALGGGLARLVRSRGIPANSRFAGVYDFATATPFAELLPRLLDADGPPDERRLVMVHPGIPDEELRRVDSLIEPRRAEYDYLKGPAFAELLERRGIRLTRFAGFTNIRA